MQNKKFGFELLWTNPNQSSTFSAQTVSIDTSKYSRFLVLASYYDSTTYKSNELLNIKGIEQIMQTPMASFTKRVAIINDDGIAFSNGAYINSGSWKDDNANVVPKFIYGVY